MLRASFPVAIHADEATYEIQYGHLRRPTHRNTTWDLARDEVVAHKWADLSQGDYGVALLNDSKYGHKIKGHTLDLNLLRSAPYPGSELAYPKDVKPGEPNHGFTDQCDHVFTYALYPHLGGPVEGGVIQAGYELNVPLRVASLSVQRGATPREASFLTVDVPNVVVEAVKQRKMATASSCGSTRRRTGRRRRSSSAASPSRRRKRSTWWSGRSARCRSRRAGSRWRSARLRLRQYVCANQGNESNPPAQSLRGRVAASAEIAEIGDSSV
jgi:hypothetical protein